MTNPPDTPPLKYSGARTPAVDRLSRVAMAIGEELREQVVFIGGSILPFLQTDEQVFATSRPTKDVDGVFIARRYTDKHRVEEQLRALKFRHVIGNDAHIDKWQAPDGTVFDLVSCGDHSGGTGNSHDLYAIENSVWLDLPPAIRHVSAVAFLLLKCGAFRDRGIKHPLQSKDLMDIVVLAATRPTLPSELLEAPSEMRAFVGDQVQTILKSPRMVSAIPTHINDRQPLADDVEALVIECLTSIASQNSGLPMNGEGTSHRLETGL